MRLLLDTHVYLWWLTDDPRLPDAAREAIAEPTTLVHVSAASVWEAAIKARLGRLALGGSDLVQEIAADGFAELPITARHAVAAADLPPVHRDPFDRVLVAQSLLEELMLVTLDEQLHAYDVTVLGVP